MLFENILGKTSESVEFRTFLEVMVEKPRVQDEWDARFYNFREAGVSVLLREGHVTTVHLFSGLERLGSQEDRMQRFGGTFAAAISFQDKRADVERKLGQPITSRLINKSLPQEEFLEFVKLAKTTKADVQTVLPKLQLYIYRTPSGVYWSFNFDVLDDTLYAAACYIAPKGVLSEGEIPAV
jgi:hypothetical protein